MFKGLAESGIWPFTWLWHANEIRKFNKKLRSGELPRPEKLVPEFASPETLVDGDYFYNPDFYATAETAFAIRERFSALVAFRKIVHDTDRAAPQQWYVRFTDGLEINAGHLAKFFAQYPEDVYPGIAPRFGINLIAHERRMKKMLEQQAFRGEN